MECIYHIPVRRLTDLSLGPDGLWALNYFSK